MLSNTNIICEEGDDKLFTVDLVDSCSIASFDFVAYGTTRTEHCGCSWSTSTDVENYSTIIEKVQTASTTTVDLYAIVSQVPFKTCNDHSIDTIFVELVEDNIGRTADNDSQFSLDYANTNDVHLSTDAPIDKYSAVPL
jgi:hypothetical protein